MNSAFNYTLNQLVSVLGSALVNFVWQGVLIGLITAALMVLLRNAKPQTRYAIACAALGLCILLPLQAVIFDSADNATMRILDDSIGLTAGGALAAVDIPIVWTWAQTHLMELVSIWALCVVFFSIRLTVGLAWVSRICDASHNTVNSYWQTRLNNLSQRSGIKHFVPLHVVNNLDTPAVAGWLRPIVLVPASLISGMPPELLEALLAHEVAHIRRMDYAVNLVQSAVEILLFYHPAVWFISGKIRIEREQIADDMAAILIGEPRRLAFALSELEQLKFLTAQLAPAANGGNLVGRIKRLMRPDVRTVGWQSLIPAVSLVLASVAFYANAAPASAATKTTRATLDFERCDKPDYPLQSIQSKEQGTVRILFSIDAKGHVVESKVTKSSGHSMLDSAAVTGLTKCSFRPATHNGKPVSATEMVDYVWTLPD